MAAADPQRTSAVRQVSSGCRIESLGTGVIYCQLLRHYHPHVLPEAAVLKEPKNEYENTSNLKLLQTGLGKLKASKDIDVGCRLFRLPG